jgi:hypothetical protein
MIVEITDTKILMAISDNDTIFSNIWSNFVISRTLNLLKNRQTIEAPIPRLGQTDRPACKPFLTVGVEGTAAHTTIGSSFLP